MPLRHEFQNWTSAIQAFVRYPEVIAVAVLDLVSTSQLATFSAREIADPPGPLGQFGGLGVTPAGTRPYYCLEAVSAVRTGAPIAPAGIDYCKTALGPGLLSTRDTEGRLLALWDRKSRDACAWYSGLPWRIRSVDRRCSSRSLHWMDRHLDQASCSARIRIERSSGDGRGVSIQRSMFERNLSGRVGP